MRKIIHQISLWALTACLACNSLVPVSAMGATFSGIITEDAASLPIGQPQVQVEPATVLEPVAEPVIVTEPAPVTQAPAQTYTAPTQSYNNGGSSEGYYTTYEETEPETITVTEFDFVNTLVFPDARIDAPRSYTVESDNTMIGQRMNASRFAQSATTIEGAGDIVRDYMIDRAQNIELAVDVTVPVSDSDYEEYKSFYSSTPSLEQLSVIKLAAMILREASYHSGSAETGDYLFFNFGSCHYSFDNKAEGDRMYGSLTISDIEYLTTEEQQEYIEQASNDLIAKYDLRSQTDFDKVRIVYEWLYDNVDYDNAHTGNKDYYAQYSAYGVFHDGKAVCQGYCNAAYYILNKVGVDTRIVCGNNPGHTWLIVKLGDKYYNLDPTWDASAEDKDHFSYFLKGSESFDKEHKRNRDYSTDSFMAAYPMSAEDYIVKYLDIDESHLHLSVDETYKLNLVYKEREGSELTFTSSDKSVAIVDEDGTITGISYGEAVITATYGEDTDTVKVTVARKYDLDISVKDNITDKVTGSGKYYVGQLVEVQAVRNTDDGYVFDSWDIPEDLELLDGKTKNDYHISFKMPAYTMELVARYKVIKVYELTLDKTSINFENIGDESKIVTTITPENAKDTKVTFKSDNEAVAKVSETGVVTATGHGKTNIIVSVGDITKTCAVSVKMPEHTVTVIGMNSAGEEKTQSKTVSMGDVITIAVSDLSDKGYAFKGWNATPEVTYAKDTKASDLKVSFIVPDADVTMKAVYEEIKVDSIKLDTDAVSMDIGDTHDLIITLAPENAKDKTLSITSGNDEVAEVDMAGKIAAKKTGQTTITVKCGDASAEVKVTVKAKEPESDVSSDGYIHINASSIKLYVDNTYQLKLTTKNVDDVTYKSSNSSIAKVDPNGLITGVAEGTSTITAVSQKANVSDDVEVTVVSKTVSSSDKDKEKEKSGTGSKSGVSDSGSTTGSTSGKTNSGSGTSSGSGSRTSTSSSSNGTTAAKNTGTSSSTGTTGTNNTSMNASRTGTTTQPVTTQSATQPAQTTQNTQSANTQKPANTSVSTNNNITSGDMEGMKVDTDAAAKYKASAIRYKADADKIRADALRNGTFESDGSSKAKMAELTKIGSGTPKAGQGSTGANGSADGSVSNGTATVNSDGTVSVNQNGTGDGSAAASNASTTISAGTKGGSADVTVNGKPGYLNIFAKGTGDASGQRMMILGMALVAASAVLFGFWLRRRKEQD